MGLGQSVLLKGRRSRRLLTRVQRHLFWWIALLIVFSGALCILPTLREEDPCPYLLLGLHRLPRARIAESQLGARQSLVVPIEVKTKRSISTGASLNFRDPITTIRRKATAEIDPAACLKPNQKPRQVLPFVI